MQQQEEEFFSPSFSSYSTNSVAEIAGKISDGIAGNVDGADATEEDFEFSLVSENPGSSQMQPIFPVFSRDLLLNDVYYNGESSENVDGSVQVTLKDLLLEEREPLSSSSSEADELESLPPGSYCVWKPKINEPNSPSTCKKSNSTGSAFKRWSIRDLMCRSNSDGKESFVFLTREKGTKNEISKSKSAAKLKSKGSTSSSGGDRVSPPSPAAVYSRNQAAKEMDKNKRKSYLPYKRYLVGFFAANSFGRTFPPF
ncbi:hypothetical protein P3S67_025488 [Capsicum chacoense]